MNNLVIEIFALGFVLVFLLGAGLILYLLFENSSLRKQVTALQGENLALRGQVNLLREVLTKYLETEKEISHDRQRTEMLDRVLRELRNGRGDVGVNVINAGAGATLGPSAAGAGISQG